MPSAAKAAAVEEESGGDSSVPWEFTEAAVEASREGAFTPYEKEMKANNSLNQTFLINNPWLEVPPPGSELSFGEFYPEGSEFEGYPKKYYDTLPMDEHPYYKDLDYPKPTKDIQRLRHDLFDWGFCLIEDAIGEESRIALRARLEEQAEAERIAEIAHFTPFFQIVWYLINKGECFRRCIEHDPEWIQGARVIEQLLNEFLGKRWYSYSMAGNISYPGCKPQSLHQDQGAILPLQTPQSPVLVNTMYILQDVNETNGGTLLIPSSHRILSEAGSGGEVGKLPPAINLEAPAGTVMLFDGRTLHGTGANRSKEWRYVMTQANNKTWLRQQESWMLMVSPDIIANASDKLLRRMGLSKNALKVRQELETGTFNPVGELTRELAEKLEPNTYSVSQPI